ncbi:MAG: hypothetical protein GXX83_00810 [Gaiellales bacterium]|nr:hypothetical protein [Gaiellales bacterium]
MPVTLSIKNVPDDIARKLRLRAASHQRTLQEELLDMVKQAVKDDALVTLDGIMAAAQRKKPALDEAADRVRSAQDAEQKRVAQRFEDLLGSPDRPTRGTGPGRSGGGGDVR